MSNPEGNKEENEKVQEQQEQKQPSSDKGLKKIENQVGQKTIVCWNCLSVLMVKEVWSIVECTTCGKYNRVPDGDGVKEKKNYVEINENLNHFDLQIPYVFAIITCPFCRTENRFKRDANHVVCYKCHHSFQCKNELQNGNSLISNSNQDYLGRGPITIKDNEEKVPRFSDYYFPDMMYFRGYYPQPYIISSCNCSETENVLRKLLKVLKKKKKPKPTMIYPPVDRFAPMRQFVRDIDDIDSRRRLNGSYSDYYSLTEPNRKILNRGNSVQSLERYKNNIYDEVYGWKESYNNNRYGTNESKGYGDYQIMKNDAINKMMFGMGNGSYPRNNQYSNNYYI